MFKDDFQVLTKNFSDQEHKSLRRCFFAIGKDILKELQENTVIITSFTEAHLLQIKKSIGKKKFADKELLAQIEKLAFEFKFIFLSANTILLSSGLMEINFIEQFKFNRIDLDKNQDYYIEQLCPYIKQKISAVRKTGTYETFAENLEESEYIKTKKASDLEILYAFLKNSLAFKSYLMSAAIVKLMKTYDSNISFPESIKKQIERFF